MNTLKEAELWSAFLEMHLCNVRHQVSEFAQSFWNDFSSLSSSTSILQNVVLQFERLSSEIGSVVESAERIDEFAKMPSLENPSFLAVIFSRGSVKRLVLTIVKAVLFFQPPESFVKFVQQFYSASFRAFDAQQKSSEGEFCDIKIAR